MKRFVILGGLVLATLVGLALVSNMFPPPEKPEREEVSSKMVSGGPRQASPTGGPQDATGGSVEVVPVISQLLERTIHLQGELRPYLSVDIYPKVTGIVEWIEVDRGSMIKKNDPLIRLNAPELREQRMEAEAQLKAAKVTYSRLKAASSTPGVVAGNDLELALHHQEAANARVQSLREMENYLHISAPFDGVVVQRNVHPGAMVGPTGGAGGNMPLLKVEQIQRLRLIVPVPEMYTGSIAQGVTVEFTVPAYPEAVFTGVITRVSRSVDQKTRTMPVEMDVVNADGRLASGMFPEVRWPVKRPTPTLFVPISAIATTTEQTFVIRVTDHEAEWVTVKKGTVNGRQVEVFGALQPGDQILLRGTDEIRPGTKVDPMLHPDKL